MSILAFMRPAKSGKSDFCGKFARTENDLNFDKEIYYGDD